MPEFIHATVCDTILIEDGIRSVTLTGKQWVEANETSNLHRELVAVAMLAFDVHDDLFSQCLSNGMKDAWGKPVNCTKINEMGSAAQSVLRKLGLYPKLLEGKLAAVMAELKETPNA